MLVKQQLKLSFEIVALNVSIFSMWMWWTAFFCPQVVMNVRLFCFEPSKLISNSFIQYLMPNHDFQRKYNTMLDVEIHVERLWSHWFQNIDFSLYLACLWGKSHLWKFRMSKKVAWILRWKKNLKKVMNLSTLLKSNFFEHSSLLEGICNVLVFNPPYVCCDQSEFVDSDLTILGKTWNGGSTGTEVLQNLIPLLPNFMAPNGLFYLVAISTNDIRGIVQQMKSHRFSEPVVVKQRKIIGEHLHILRFQNLRGKET